MKIGLCLSGGGFRATLFHLGVIRELQNRGLLSDVRIICGVSGGSIAAAHLAQKWDSYISSLKNCEEQAGKVVALARRDVRGRTTRGFFWRYFLRRRPNLSHLLMDEYDVLFDKKRMSTLPPEPRVELISASLTLPDAACSFSGSNFSVWHSTEGLHLSSGRTPISAAVAASSAFPALFPPIVCDYKLLGVDQRDLPLTHYLTDGGVLDNTGLQVMSKLIATENLDYVITSNAGAELDWATKNPLASGFRWFPRMVEVLSEVGSEGARKRAATSIAAACNLIEIDLDMEGATEHPLPGDSRNAARRIRTDFDTFSEHEIRCLVWHGQSVAHKILNGHFPDHNPEESAFWDPIPKGPADWRSEESAAPGLEHSWKRTVRPFGMDRATLINASLILALLCLIIGGCLRIKGIVSPPPIPPENQNPIFLNELFTKNGNFFAKVRSGHKPLKSSALDCDTDIWIHYIDTTYQFGLHACLGVSPTADASTGIFRARVVDVREDTPSITPCWRWSDQSTDPLLCEPLNHDNKYSLNFSKESPKNLLFGAYFPDYEPPADFFVFPTSEFFKPGGAKRTKIEHYIIIRAGWLSTWNPNKYIFEIENPNQAIIVSPLVYEQLSPSEYDSPSLRRVRDLFSKVIITTVPEFLSPQDAVSKSETIARKRAKDDLDRIKNGIASFFTEGQISNDVTLFRMTTEASDNDHVFVFRFESLDPPQK